MKRKRFLGTLLGSPFVAAGTAFTPDIPAGPPVSPELPWHIPPSLKSGDTIGITCPAGFISMDDMKPALRIMEDWGFRLRLGKTVGKRNFTFGGTDSERAADLQQMMDDPTIRAIMCARGGYGLVRIIDQLDFRKFSEHPKWIVGFSDITVMHAHLSHNYHVASIHSKMCNSFPDNPQSVERAQWESILSIKLALAGEKIDYPVVFDIGNRLGTGQGVLVGGNLKTIETLAGSSSDLHTDGAILFLEDTGEYLYSIDRMFWNLKRSGKLEKLNGLIIGAFRVKGDDPGDEFGKSIYNIVHEQVAEYKYPVCFNFPVGHQKVNYALKCGVRHELKISPGRVNFKAIT